MWAILLAGVGILGAIGSKSLGNQFSKFWLILFVAAAAIGVIVGLSVFPLLIAVLASLAYWDLDGFQQRLSRVDSSDWTHNLEKSHIRRLLIALGLGLAASLIGLLIRTDLSMIWAILLGLVIVVSLRMGIRALQYPEKSTRQTSKSNQS
jgi:predicted membrane-bound spermidine synthase